MWKYIGKKECNEFLLSLFLIDEKDNKKYINKLYSISNNIDKNYRIYKILKRNGKYRTIYEPSKTLKHIQKQILKNVLEKRQISSYAKAYHKGVSLKDNALVHVNKKIILKLDIKSFFDNISFYQVYSSCFEIELFPKSVGMLLTQLCTYDGHLTQGSPTSSYISNLVMRNFDEELGSWCNNHNISYTRYSDDMTFSGDFIVSDVIRLVRKMLYKLGLELNQDKISIINNSNSQYVTGLVVNEKVQVSKKYRNKIRQEIYYIKKYGISSHINRLNISSSEKDYLKKLNGRILYVLQIDENNKEFLEYKKYIRDLIS